MTSSTNPVGGGVRRGGAPLLPRERVVYAISIVTREFLGVKGRGRRKAESKRGAAGSAKPQAAGVQTRPDPQSPIPNPSAPRPPHPPFRAAGTDNRPPGRGWQARCCRFGLRSRPKRGRGPRNRQGFRLCWMASQVRAEGVVPPFPVPALEAEGGQGGVVPVIEIGRALAGQVAEEGNRRPRCRPGVGGSCPAVASRKGLRRSWFA